MSRFKKDGRSRGRSRGKNVTASARANVFARDNYTCVSCGEYFGSAPAVKQQDRKPGENYLTINHIIPKGLGGSNIQENLETMCYECNQIDGKEYARAYLESGNWFGPHNVRLTPGQVCDRLRSLSKTTRG